MSKISYETKLASIEAISNDLVTIPDIPVAIALQEAEDLYEWCLSDKDSLIRAGLNWELAEDLPERVGACRYIQSQWQKEYKSMEEAQKEWSKKSPTVYALHDELIHHMYHAYHSQSDLISKVQKIDEGTGNADMIQDLSDISALGKANPQPLKLINLDLTLLDTAETLAENMSVLLAKANGLRMSDNKLKVLRDKAYSYMKEAVDEIRRNGQYVFWRNPERKKGYRSNYIRKMNMPKTEKTEILV